MAEKSSPYAVPLAALEHDVHVPVEDQVSEQGEPPPPPPLPQGDLDRMRLLGITSAGRLRD